jgi:serine protease
MSVRPTVSLKSAARESCAFRFTETICRTIGLPSLAACALVLWSGLACAQEIPWHLGRVDGAQSAPSAINTAGHQPGPHRIVVAVIDSGVIASHPSLEGQLLPGYDMISARLNLRKSRSSNFSPDERDAKCGERLLSNSFRTHGTEVASLIAGNGQGGVLGVNPSSQIVPVRLFGACATSRQDLLDAIAWAAGFPVQDVPDNPHPARIINLSLSGGFMTCGEDMQRLLQRVMDQNIFVVAAAGNNFQKPLQEPSNCKGVISVGALDAQNRIAAYSALDPRTVVYAPGGGPALSGNDQWSVNKLKVASYEPNFIGQDRPSQTYRGVGTSYAAPIVAGFISLWLSHKPEKTPFDFFKEMNQFSRQVEPIAACAACAPRGLAGMQAIKGS